jgi:capsular polysaccharide biosynthesis protein
MEKHTDHEYYQKDELELYDLWRILKKRWALIFIITLVLTGLAFSHIFLTQKVYRVHNIIIFNQMPDWDLFKQSEISAAVNVLNKLNNISDLEKDKIMSTLGLHEKDLRNIKNIKSSEIIGSSAVWVDIDTTDKRSGVALMETMPDYILSTPYISNQLILQKSLMIKNREDLKAIIDNPTRNLQLSRNTVIYLPSIDLYSLQAGYNRVNLILQKMDKGQLISLAWKTELPIVPFKPNKIINIMIGILVGCILGIFMAFFMEWIKKVQYIHSDNLEK